MPAAGAVGWGEPRNHRRSSRDGLCTSVRAVRSWYWVGCSPTKRCRSAHTIFYSMIKYKLPNVPVLCKTCTSYHTRLGSMIRWYQMLHRVPGTNLSRETKVSGVNEDREHESGASEEREIFIFLVQLTTSMIGNFTRLVHILLYIIPIYTRTSLCCLSYQ